MDAAKQYLYKIEPTRSGMLSEGPTPTEQSVISEHFEYLKDLTGAGVVLLAGRTLNTDRTSFGIVIFRAASDDEARRLMEGDPAVRKGVMRAELFPYRIALAGNIPKT
jgi:uncharacterized protein YciI